MLDDWIDEVLHLALILDVLRPKALDFLAFLLSRKGDTYVYRCLMIYIFMHICANDFYDDFSGDLLSARGIGTNLNCQFYGQFVEIQSR